MHRSSSPVLDDGHLDDEGTNRASCLCRPPNPGPCPVKGRRSATTHDPRTRDDADRGLHRGPDCTRGQAQTEATSLEVAVGETVEVEIVIDPHGTVMSGAVVFLSIQGGAFVVLDLGLQDEAGTQPFRPGPLFESRPITNLLLPDTEDPVAKQIPGLQLDYGTIVADLADAPGEVGVLATMTLLAVGPSEQASIVIDDNPIRETRIVAEDFISEKRFVAVNSMEIRVVDAVTAVGPQTWGGLKLQAESGR